jgi:erythromycin esterase-like protein
MKSNPKDFESIKFQFDNYAGWGLQSRYDFEGYNIQSKFINGIIEDYVSTGNQSYKITQWKSILSHFYWMYKRSLVLKDNKYSNVIETEKQRSLFHSDRDSIMADNFLADYRLRENQKAVVLVSCYHSVRNSQSIESVLDCCTDPKVNIWGDLISKALSSKLYSICFARAGGKSGINYYTKGNNYKINTSLKNSLEYFLAQRTESYSFIDLTNSSLSNKSFYLRVLFDRFLQSNWSQNFSGVFFIKEMQPLNFTNESVLLNEDELK